MSQMQLKILSLQTCYSSFGFCVKKCSKKLLKFVIHLICETFSLEFAGSSTLKNEEPHSCTGLTICIFYVLQTATNYEINYFNI